MINSELPRRSAALCACSGVFSRRGEAVPRSESLLALEVGLSTPTQQWQMEVNRDPPLKMWSSPSWTLVLGVGCEPQNYSGKTSLSMINGYMIYGFSTWILAILDYYHEKQRQYYKLVKLKHNVFTVYNSESNCQSSFIQQKKKHQINVLLKADQRKNTIIINI